MAMNDSAHCDDELGGADALVPVATPIDAPIEFQVSPNPMLLESIPRSKAAGHLLLLVGAYFLIVLSVSVGVRMMYPTDADMELFSSSAGPMVITVCVGMALVSLAVGQMWLSSCSVESIGMSFSQWKIDIPLGILVAGASYVGYFITMVIVASIWPESIKQMISNPRRVEAMLPPINPVLLTLMIVVVAFWEEAIFRGVLVTHLRRIIGGWTLAVLIPACLFGVLHIGAQEPIVAIPLAVLGVIWALFTLWRRSILASVVGHTLFNLGQIYYIKHSANGA